METQRQSLPLVKIFLYKISPLQLNSYVVVFHSDIAAPHFNGTCPRDFNVLVPRGKEEAVVTWTQPIVMDNEGYQLNVTSSRQPGVTLPEGLHAILIKAVDQSGNQATCRFVVNVTG